MALTREQLQELRGDPFAAPWTVQRNQRKKNTLYKFEDLGVAVYFFDEDPPATPVVVYLDEEVGGNFHSDSPEIYSIEEWQGIAETREPTERDVLAKIAYECAVYLLNQPEENNMPINAPKKRISPNVNTKSAKAAIMDGAKTAAASTVADRIRRLLTKRLENTPLQPVITFIPDDVLNFLFAMAISTAADYAPGVPKRDAVKRTAMFAVEGSSHDAIKALTGFLADLFGEIVKECADVLKGVGEE